MIKSLYPQFMYWAGSGAVWIISDTHFDAPDCKLYNPNWPTAEEYIAKVKPMIGKYDTLVHLGDVGNMKWMDKFDCHKILIMGNHDPGAEVCEQYFNEVYNGPLFIADRILLSHIPIFGLEDICLNIHGHTHDCPDDFEGHLNLASDNCDWLPFNLGRAIKNGLLSNYKNYNELYLENLRKL